jgi:hypothetical protein
MLNKSRGCNHQTRNNDGLANHHMGIKLPKHVHNLQTYSLTKQLQQKRGQTTKRSRVYSKQEDMGFKHIPTVCHP